MEQRRWVFAGVEVDVLSVYPGLSRGGRFAGHATWAGFQIRKFYQTPVPRAAAPSSRTNTNTGSKRNCAYVFERYALSLMPHYLQSCLAKSKVA